jgi:hypothetical protein
VSICRWIRTGRLGRPAALASAISCLTLAAVAAVSVSLVALLACGCEIAWAAIYARNASVGLSRAAFIAGYSPASAPITNPADGAAISA